ncbi:CAF17-like 4Fe-4S cluster assembly/insertion protein YgfZ [Salinarimonas ramus]|uniref:Folate-binding protein n=1 Tax=Salinarimonas ramus TaxID=690164 RepID=A0A917Q7A6_9HYPH|nr:folate-binding protein YgfZ [Salinarimonas ramus]GGK32409.1 folate-binding protein [Salinarimonas ramus]
MPVVHLADRAVLEVSGPQAASFLDGLVTCDVDAEGCASPLFGALLTPQGKILFDFLIHRVPRGGAEGEGEDGQAFLLDTPAAFAADLAKRLTFYRLRAKVAIADVSAERAVLAGWDAPPPVGEAIVAGTDPRLADLGWRAIVPRSSVAGLADAQPQDYHAHRIACGVPEGGKDYLFGETFPHEALMDQVAGVDFEKGCYVGQEVVSRMQHRGTARTRILPATYEDDLAPETGADVLAGERTIGKAGSSAGGRGLVMVRLDRVGDALAEGVEIRAGGRKLTLLRPRFVRFETPAGIEALTKD